MEEKPKYSKDLKDLEERFFQKAESEKEKAKADIDKKIESFHQKLIVDGDGGLVGKEKEWLLKEMRESLYSKYVDTTFKGAKEIKERLRKTKHKLDDHETNVRRAQEKIKTLSHKELWDGYLEADKRIEREKKLGRE